MLVLADGSIGEASRRFWGGWCSEGVVMIVGVDESVLV